MEDEDLGGIITRQEFEELCADMVPVMKEVVSEAIECSGIAKHEFAFVEISGGVARVPWIKTSISKVTGFETLSTTLNMDECVARGCALQAAILSPMFKVRDFAVVDYPKYPININWSSDAGAADDDVEMEGTEAGKKTSAALITPTTFIPTYKNVSFKRKGPFTVTFDYAEPEKLPPSTDPCVGRFEISLPAGDAAKKVKVRTSLNYHGMTTFDKAELAEEEEYEETVKEKKEIPQDETEEKDVEMKEAKEGETAEGAATESESEAKGEPKKKEPKYEWVDVKKMKKRTKVTDLAISRTGVVGMTVADLQI